MFGWCRLHSDAPQLYHHHASGPGYQEFFIRLGFGLRDGGVARDVLYEFPPSFGSFTLNDANAACGHVAGLEANDAAIAYFDVGAKPIRAEHSARGIERYRGRDRTFEIGVSAGENALAHFLSPSHAADEGIVQAAALKWHGVREP